MRDRTCCERTQRIEGRTDQEHKRFKYVGPGCIHFATKQNTSLFTEWIRCQETRMDRETDMFGYAILESYRFSNSTEFTLMYIRSKSEVMVKRNGSNCLVGQS